MNPHPGLKDTRGVARDIKRYDFSMPFWEATREKRLLIQYCRTSHNYQHYPRPVSVFTGRRRDLEWREVSGLGAVYSHTITHRSPPEFRAAEPFAVVSVLLDVGVRIIANTVDVSAGELQVGLRVKPYWHALEDGTHLLMFQPDRDKE